MQTLQSYVVGRWHEATEGLADLVDPTSGQVVARTGSAGIDFRAVVEHARTKGGPTLRALTFLQRGEALQALSAAIHEVRDELIELSAANGGCTRGDAKFDIDGATGTLAAYAHYAKGLGERPFLADGEGLQLGRTARFWGQHVWVTRPGVAVHVNAFNFPAWGMLEKAACALLAGVPVIEKPATATALVAWRVARAVVESGILPEGAFQLIAGGVGDLFDHLGAQDAVAFTGSAETGRKISGHPSLLARGVRVNIEADSLNAAVLAPDVAAESETYGLFLSNVALDMTQKTGQKCTAVRRILVPAERVAEVERDLSAALERIQVGDPRDKANRMGPVVHAGQLEDVRSGIGRLAEVADVVLGGAEPLGDGGSFVRATLLVAREPRSEVLHSLEVFGPVATIVPYDGSVAEAVELVNLGGGSLVNSVYSNDADWTQDYVLGVAPWHGRVWIASDRMAEQSLPPGMVLPGLVHGGPGRAGGGEELGGLRGLELYMQRVALQGFKGFVESRFGAGKPA